jgi:zinc/manganese transport system permease protein
MIDIIIFMAPAICMCIILVGICGYVGIHVVMREVIFIDIALAQIAALGTSFGLLWGFETSSIWAFVISLIFTFLAAILLSISRKLSSIVPQEAFIGILYATGAAAVLLAGDRLPHGNEYVHDLMCGHLLWVNWKEVGLYLLIYLALGFIYIMIHKRLIKISQTPKAEKTINNSFILWDFIFYALLGLLVTFAVIVAGILLVFGFLIVPAVIGILIGKSFLNRLMIGWIYGVIISFIGGYLSYILDFPTGATVVVCLGLSLLLIAFTRGFYLKYS